MRDIKFSRVFPVYHPRKGEATYFPEKVLNFLEIDFMTEWYRGLLIELNPALPIEIIDQFLMSLDPSIYSIKSHTGRSGKRWKEGDLFQPTAWSGKPYRSKVIKIAPPIKIERLFDFQLKDNEYILCNKRLNLSGVTKLAMNDGLTADDFECWFAKDPVFDGQIICWNKDINY